MNKKIGYIVVGVVVLAGVFYTGMTYGKSQVAAAAGAQQTAFGLNSGTRGTRSAGGFTTGQIISKDAQSVTVQLVSGGPAGATTQTGSKIVFFDSNTKVVKTVNGALTDLAIGTDVTVTGTPNSDGSINATSVQIRPNVPQGARVQ